MASQMIECYQFRCHFAESQEMKCYLKQETYSGPISFEVQQNDISELITFNHLRCHSSSIELWGLELVTESQLEKVQMKPPTI